MNSFEHSLEGFVELVHEDHVRALETKDGGVVALVLLVHLLLVLTHLRQFMALTLHRGEYPPPFDFRGFVTSSALHFSADVLNVLGLLSFDFTLPSEEIAHSSGSTYLDSGPSSISGGGGGKDGQGQLSGGVGAHAQVDLLQSLGRVDF